MEGLVNIRVYRCDITRQTYLELDEHVGSYFLTFENKPAAKKAKRAFHVDLQGHVQPMTREVRVAKPAIFLPQLRDVDRYRPDPGDIGRTSMLEEPDRSEKPRPKEQ